MENIILLHEIDVQGKSKTAANQILSQYKAHIIDALSNQKGLTISNIFVPTCKTSDVTVLYPLPNYVDSQFKVNYSEKLNEIIFHLNEKEDED